MNVARRLLLPALTFAVSLVATSPSFADTITIVGNSTGSQATATEVSSFNAVTNTFTFTLTNTSPFDARITGVGFDVLPGDPTGFTGANVGAFTFVDQTSLGNVPQFNSAELDFGWLTGSNFGGGSPNAGIAPGSSLTFAVSSPLFAGMTETSISQDIFVRFQRVGADGEGSDVGVFTPPPPNQVPDSGSSLLLFSGSLAALSVAARRKRWIRAVGI